MAIAMDRPGNRVCQYSSLWCRLFCDASGRIVRPRHARGDNSIWPIYYRVTPGMLEGLWYSGVRSRVVSHTTLPLRNARIICHYDRHRLEIATLKGRGGPEHKEDAQTSQRRLTVDIDLRKVRHRHRFVEAVFRGAMCAHSAPSLPSDTLVG